MLATMRSRGLAVGAPLVAVWCAISVIGPHLVPDPIEHGLAAGAPGPPAGAFRTLDLPVILGGVFATALAVALAASIVDMVHGVLDSRLRT
jgi:hypothetical protein